MKVRLAIIPSVTELKKHPDCDSTKNLALGEQLENLKGEVPCDTNADVKNFRASSVPLTAC